MSHRRFCDTAGYTCHCWECINAIGWRALPTEQEIQDAYIAEEYDKAHELEHARMAIYGDGQHGYAICKYVPRGTHGYVTKYDSPNNGSTRAAGCGYYETRKPRKRKR
jgi:hypothetical protein